MGETKDLAAFAWDGHSVYGDNDSIKAVHAAVTEAAKLPELRARLDGRPDWGEVYRETAHTDNRDNDLVIVTRETARLARSAIDTQQAQDGYHNFGAARQELDKALSSGEQT
jgi:hypothetical protein